MVNYENGKIYKLVNDEMGLTYYGSTCKKYLSSRLSGHIYDAKKIDKYVSSKQLFEKGSVKIYLVELFPCGSKDELHARERYYIENNECVNHNIPCRTKKEWEEDNKEKLAEKGKQYHQNNKEKINTRTKTYYEANKATVDAKRTIKIDCPCGISYQHCKKARHLKTLKHLSFLK